VPLQAEAVETAQALEELQQEHAACGEEKRGLRAQLMEQAAALATVQSEQAELQGRVAGLGAELTAAVEAGRRERAEWDAMRAAAAAAAAEHEREALLQQQRVYEEQASEVERKVELLQREHAEQADRAAAQVDVQHETQVGNGCE
jgi:chromosome segregation ATPase